MQSTNLHKGPYFPSALPEKLGLVVNKRVVWGGREGGREGGGGKEAECDVKKTPAPQPPSALWERLFDLALICHKQECVARE